MRSSLAGVVGVIWACGLALSCDRAGRVPVEVAAPEPTPASDSPDPEPPVAAQQPQPWSAPALTPVFTRDGPVSLHVQAGRAALVIDAWPRTLESTGVTTPSPEPTLIDRSKPWELHPTDYVETDAGEAFLTVQTVHPRSGRGRAASYRRDAQGWAKLEPTPRPDRLGHYGLLLARDGAVFGRPSFVADPDADPDAPIAAYQRQFVRLAGPPDAPVPELPQDGVIYRLRAGDDGTLYALARLAEPEQPKGQLSPRFEVWTWAPGETVATAIELPEAARDAHLDLSVSGSRVLVHGEGRYLVEVSANPERIPVELPDEEEFLDVGQDIGAALRTPAGELWITLDVGIWGQRMLVVRSNDGDWHPVETPALPEELVPLRPWVYDDGWSEAQFEGAYRFALYETLAWVHGRVWVLASFGPLDNGTAFHWLRRSVLYAVGDPKPTAAPEVAPPAYADWAKQAQAPKQARRAPGDCEVFWVELDASGRADALDSATLDALAELNDGDELRYWLDRVFVAELDGRRTLVVQVRLGTEQAAKRGLELLGQTLGRKRLTASCRAPQPVEAVRSFMD